MPGYKPMATSGVSAGAQDSLEAASGGFDPLKVTMLGVGTAIRAYGDYLANQQQAEDEQRNAQFYREQATYARQSGERQQAVFDRESEVIYGEQKAAFAKAGVDTSGSSLFLAKTMLYRQNESEAIKAEAETNVRLAMLRADSASRNAQRLTDPTNNALQLATTALTGIASIL